MDVQDTREQCRGPVKWARATHPRTGEIAAGLVPVQHPAVLGGPPVFEHTAAVGRPNSPGPDALLPRIEEILHSGRYSNFGPEVEAFETRVADIAGARHAISTCNATVALQLLLETLGWRGEVIVPAFTFIADPHAITLAGAIPKFCDIDPVTHSLDPIAVEAAITANTVGILGVHLWGDQQAAAALETVAKRHGLPVVFDAAHAFACHEEKESGRVRGLAEVYSFHATKLVHTVEGGVVVTDDDELAVELRKRSNFGFDGEDRVTGPGTNAKLGEMSAAMGHAMLDRLDEIINRNRLNFQMYARVLATVPGIALRHVNTAGRHNYHYVVAEVDAERAGITRDELVAALRLENVVARRYFYPGCHRATPYSEQPWHLPNTEEAGQRTLVLPTGLAMTPEDVWRLASCIASLVTQAPAVVKALRQCQDSRLPDFPLRVTQDRYTDETID